jgi:hypothetical protein
MKESTTILFEEFSAAHPYLNSARTLDKYAKLLRRERDMVEDEIEELVGADVTIASAQGTPPPLATPIPVFTAPASSSVRLKPLEIPTFNGDITEFPSFKETFIAATLNMPAVAQFLHLKTHLSGSALAAVSDLPTNENSIRDAWRILTTEFGNPSALQDALYNSLQNLKATDGRAPDLRRFVDSLEQICLKLTRAGENPDQRFLTNIVERKMPFNILQEIHKAKLSNAGSHWSMTDLKQKLKDILKLRESMNRVMDQIHVENPRPSGQSRPPPIYQQPGRPLTNKSRDSSNNNQPRPH